MADPVPDSLPAALPSSPPLPAAPAPILPVSAPKPPPSLERKLTSCSVPTISEADQKEMIADGVEVADLIVDASNLPAAEKTIIKAVIAPAASFLGKCFAAICPCCRKAKPKTA